MTVSKTTDANRTHGTIVLRGGRLTKWKGKAASLSPSLGQLIASVSPVALGRALMVGASKTATAAVLGGAGLIVTTSGASAGCCSGSDGVYTCSGTMRRQTGIATKCLIRLGTIFRRPTTFCTPVEMHSTKE